MLKPEIEEEHLAEMINFNQNKQTDDSHPTSPGALQRWKTIILPRYRKVLSAAVVVFLLVVLSTVVASQGVDRSAATTSENEREAMYRGYATVFVLGHIFARVMGTQAVMPRSINLDFFTHQPGLAEGGDLYVYRAGLGRDVMWPLVLPTPPRVVPTPLPTATPRPVELQSTEPTETPTPTPSPTPTEVIPPPFRIQAVSRAQHGDLVMIGNQMYAVGDIVLGATVVEIQSRYAVISYYGRTFVVSKLGTVPIEDFHEEDLLFD